MCLLAMESLDDKTFQDNFLEPLYSMFKNERDLRVLKAYLTVFPEIWRHALERSDDETIAKVKDMIWTNIVWSEDL